MLNKIISNPGSIEGVIFFFVVTVATLIVCIIIVVVVGETMVKISDYRKGIHRKSLIDRLRRR
jgi:hypothetical protein